MPTSKVTRHDKKIKDSFVLRPTFRYFVLSARSYSHSEMKRKASFPFAFLSFIRNFATTKRSYTVSTEQKWYLLFFV